MAHIYPTLSSVPWEKEPLLSFSAAAVCHPRFCSCTLDRGQNMFFPELIFTVLYVKKFLVFKLNKYVNLLESKLKIKWVQIQWSILRWVPSNLNNTVSMNSEPLISKIESLFRNVSRSFGLVCHDFGCIWSLSLSQCCCEALLCWHVFPDVFWTVIKGQHPALIQPHMDIAQRAEAVKMNILHCKTLHLALQRALRSFSTKYKRFTILPNPSSTAER